MSPENQRILDRLLAIQREKILMRPAIFDYPVYEEFIYEIMCSDKTRAAAYKTVIEKTVKGKKVVEIGTGAMFPLAKLCIESGADIVYAIEYNEEAAIVARQAIAELGLSDKIMVFVGSSLDIDLPEKVDVCVSELISDITSSEGVNIYIENSKRFLNDGGIMIPRRSVTKMAPMSLPVDIYTDEFVEGFEQPYLDKIKKIKGDDFQFTRFEFFNMPPECFLAKEDILEDLDFEAKLANDFQVTLSFIIEKDADFAGFLFWLALYLDMDTVIDACAEQRAWVPAYIPLQGPAFAVQVGDVMTVNCTAKTGANGINPDYSFAGSIDRNAERVHEFLIYSPH
jgi:predicted RNA methylase